MGSEIDAFNTRNIDPSAESLAECKELGEPSIAYAKEPANIPSDLDGYKYWSKLVVNHEAGTALYLPNNRPLRARKIEFIIDQLSWRYGQNRPLITDPLGNGRAAGGDFFAYGRPEYGVVLFQMRGSLQWACTVENGINQRDVLPDFNICFNVNDKNKKYGNNSGSFDVWLKVIA